MVPIYRGFIHQVNHVQACCQAIQVRVIEYVIENLENPNEQLRYRLITSLLNQEEFPAQLLAIEYHQR